MVHRPYKTTETLSRSPPVKNIFTITRRRYLPFHCVNVYADAPKAMVDKTTDAFAQTKARALN